MEVDRAENAREPKLLTCHFANVSRSGALRRPEMAVIAEDALGMVGSLPLLQRIRRQILSKDSTSSAGRYIRTLKASRLHF